MSGKPLGVRLGRAVLFWLIIFALLTLVFSLDGTWSWGEAARAAAVSTFLGVVLACANWLVVRATRADYRGRVFWHTIFGGPALAVTFYLGALSTGSDARMGLGIASLVAGFLLALVSALFCEYHSFAVLETYRLAARVHSRRGARTGEPETP